MSSTRRAVTRRVGTLVALAALPVAVLAVFFVLPVIGMVQRGLFFEGSFDPSVVTRILGRPEIQRALWFTLWSSGLATVLSVGWDIYRQINGWRESHLGRLYRPKYFHADGIAIHGYHRVPSYPASHGCVRVSIAAMDYLWPRLPIGTPVLVY